MKKKDTKRLFFGLLTAIVLCLIFTAAMTALAADKDAPSFAAKRAATATDVTATDVTETDATATDPDAEEPSPLCEKNGHRFRVVGREEDAVMHDVVVIAECAVCGERKKVSLADFNVPFANGEKAFADGACIVVSENTAAAELLAGCPAETVVIGRDDGTIRPEQTLGSGMTVIFPTARTYTVLLYGDADGDGQISPADARIALRLSVNLEEHIEWRDKACHVTDDGKRAVLPADARLILRASVGLEDGRFGRTGAAATPTDATPSDATPTDATPTDATPTDAAQDTQFGVYVCSWEGGAYLRKAHSFESPVAAIIPYGESVSVSGVYFSDNGDKMVCWGKIEYQGVVGWSVLDYFEEQK